MIVVRIHSKWLQVNQDHRMGRNALVSVNAKSGVGLENVTSLRGWATGIYKPWRRFGS